MSDESGTSAHPRASRFREHTNTTNSIHPPPDELWKDLGIEDLIEQYNEENRAPPSVRKTSGRTPRAHARLSATSNSKVPTSFGAPSVASPGPLSPTRSEGTFGRFQRAFSSVFGVLGKRKAGITDAEREREREKHILDERKRAADAAYYEAKELGLLPTPKVFVRPAMAARAQKCVVEVATPVRSPRTPTLHHTPSKKDLHKQKKLSKRVSDLEFKLASARKELQTVLHSDLPPVPYIPAMLPPTPNTSQSDYETSPQKLMSPASEPESIGKITKKRKAITTDDEGCIPIPTDSDGDWRSASEPERMIKRVKSSVSKKNLKRQSSRLQKKSSRSSMNKEEVVTVVPDGDRVPPIPSIPKGVVGRKVRVGDDGYGGYEHEMF